mmetsp:Transcript_56495/g.104614  ORF Transcript_56495/g.104614 Transcript_56495/m.104614 type:complete len:125 (-) Transcript_56495:8-382(-)
MTQHLDSLAPGSPFPMTMGGVPMLCRRAPKLSRIQPPPDPGNSIYAMVTPPGAPRMDDQGDLQDQSSEPPQLFSIFTRGAPLSPLAAVMWEFAHPGSWQQERGEALVHWRSWCRRHCHSGATFL